MTDLIQRLPIPPGPGFFLVGEGKMFGPYTKSEFSFLFRKGALSRFQYFWDPAGMKWRPISAMKAKPLPEREPTEPVLSEEQETAWEEELSQKIVQPPPYPKDESAGSMPTQIVTESTADRAPLTYPTVLYTEARVAAGSLTLYGTAGFTWMSPDPDVLPPFAEGTRLMANILHQRDGRAIEVHGEVTHLDRDENQWRFEVSWENYPESFFVTTPEKTS